MSSYWQAKIWGLLHDPALKALHSNAGRGQNSFWQDLAVMQDWVEEKLNPENSEKKIFKHIHLADYITSASDRGAIGSVTNFVDYDKNGLEISHLLSGAKQNLKLIDQHHQEVLKKRKEYLQRKENQLLPDLIKTEEDIQKVFWWLWRCLPEAVCQAFDDHSLMLMPAETRLPDSSIWSHASLTAAMAGALAGYNLTQEEVKGNWPNQKPLSHPYLASFTFSPIQELIKASRKMRDFWAGSWILHYLSAQVSWKLALKYGPDCLLYPSLYGQPLIDLWLLKKYPDFQQWINKPKSRLLLTAGFPNVIVMVLPAEKVAAAMEMAKSELLTSWRNIGNEVFNELHNNRNWQKDLKEDSNTWAGWLNAQWQTYWTAVPIGKKNEALRSSEIYQEDEAKDRSWTKEQNKAYNLGEKQALFQEKELKFLRAKAKIRWETQKRHPFSANVGSWWSYIFDQTRLALTAVKNARTWEIPTAFGPRSTVSGLGPVVHPEQDWITEGDSKKYWQRDAGLFDGIEQLNATETLKRGLEKILPKLLGLEKEAIAASYPDLTAGVAGYLKVYQTEPQHQEHFQKACQGIIKKFPWTEEVIKNMKNKWGIPWQDQQNITLTSHTRLLNAGWLVEDVETEELTNLEKQLKTQTNREQINSEIRRIKTEYRTEIQATIDKYYPHNNPADWYVLAAGDGDSMSKWLKGKQLKSYQEYIPQKLKDDSQEFQEFIQLKKRMGPSTHNALSRALLDFSNQLVPYLTETRYAGRLIYGGGDDVLAYTNLWEWDNWLWDIRQCFRGDKDPHNEFRNEGDYWCYQGENELLLKRPLFTMGGEATISFGIVIAHHSVPLAITLENLWEAEEKAKEHKYYSENGKKKAKDAVQIRVIYSNGNILEASGKFSLFKLWKELLNNQVENGIFETAATRWNEHPLPSRAAIVPWTKAFCNRREKLDENKSAKLAADLSNFLTGIWDTTEREKLDMEVQNWLKLAAFVMRKREIKFPGE
ncbi:MAG: type III-B CRISPR-associated protein Cas10/Cmr2 [Gomphosphaeria aponina SAG 52.96 = DSM 107014]|uniref:Type III-B CRISPR-associated protein Cas10/Cmr2 n=1 Tax=Gomphosphaeria aponina SAG 52.96 = DSM 107014 TaxID=1521640 RepID=A0A941GTQ7_9CHRO|nr:type III-B CRISPR-associated protein Cas10/Cmr2 [Gomphosphaeria aponina SAG 52.96 = DSM 107014]